MISPLPGKGGHAWLGMDRGASTQLTEDEVGGSDSAYFITSLHGRKGKESIFVSTLLVA